MPPYWSRARTYAKEHTETYSLKKAVPTVFIAILGYHFAGRGTLSQLGASIAIAVSVYAALSLAQYGWNLLKKAPETIDTGHIREADQLRTRIGELENKLTRSPADEESFQRLKMLLDGKPRNAQALKWLRNHLLVRLKNYHTSGRVETNVRPPSGMDEKDLLSVLDALEKDGVVKYEYTQHAHITERVCEIVPGFARVAEAVLYASSSDNSQT